MAVFDFEHIDNAKLVGLAGTLNAGKDTAANHLVQRHSFMHVSTGDVLRAEANKHGLEPDRNTLIDIGVRLRQEYGSQGALIIMAIEKWQAKREEYMGGLVVSGMRAIGEAEEIPTRHGKLIFVDAPIETRYARMIARQRDAEATKAFDEFAAHDQIEFEGVPDDPTRPNLSAIKSISHKVILNDRNDTELLFSNLDRTVGLGH